MVSTFQYWLSVIVVILLSCLWGTLCSGASIDRYESDITVREDGSLLIREVISFNLENGEQVKDFGRVLPGMTWLEEEAQNDDSLKVDHWTIFRFIDATFDGEPIGHLYTPYPEDLLFFSLSDKSPTTGPHTLRFEYVIDGQVGYHEKEEWLSWNVTRNTFSSTITEVIVRVHLPPSIDIRQVKGSGYGYIAPGATRDSVSPVYTGGHTLEFRNKAKLDGPRFKIGLTFPLHSFESDYRRSVRYWETDYMRPEADPKQKTWQLIILLGGFLALVCLMFLLLPGKPKGPIKQETLLAQYSPSTIGYAVAGKYHPGLLMASLINLAYSKVIHIEAVFSTNHLAIKRDANINALFTDEKKILTTLFSHSDLIQIKPGLDEQKHLFKDCCTSHERNIAQLVPGKGSSLRMVIFTLVSVALFIVNIFSVQTEMPITELLGLTIVTILFSVLTLFLLVSTVILPLIAAESIGQMISRLLSLSTFFALMFTLPSVTCLFFLVKQTGWMLVFIFLGLGILNVLFYILPGLLGRTDEAALAQAAKQLKNNLHHGKIEIHSLNDYFHKLSIAYALKVEEQLIQQFQKGAFSKQCPSQIDEKIWDKGSVAPLFARIRSLCK